MFMRLCFVLCWSIMGYSLPAQGQNRTVTYDGDFHTTFANPDRGFTEVVNPPFFTGPSTQIEVWETTTNSWTRPLIAHELRQKRLADQITVFSIRYHLSMFRTKALSPAFLQRITQDFAAARSAGVKLNLRFCYAWSGNNRPDTTKAWMFHHLDQLKPILAANEDVVSYFDLGFIGQWGQWVPPSTGGHLDVNTFGSINLNTREIYAKIMDTFPSNRMVTICFPQSKTNLVRNSFPLLPADGFSGSYRARTGYANDGMLHSADDFGFLLWDPTSYRDQNGKWHITTENCRNFLNQDCLFVPMTGELAVFSQNARSSGTNAVAEATRMRWSSLRTEGDGAAQTFNRWKSEINPITGENYYNQIKRRLGYRFRLVEASLPQSARPGGTINFVLKVANDGFSPLYNQRGLQIILRHTVSGRESILKINTDLRRWFPGTTNTVSFSAGLPRQIPTGSYSIFLAFPDPAPTLAARPEYAIRLANLNLWDATTGYHWLQSTLNIQAGSPTHPYRGSNWFHLSFVHWQEKYFSAEQLADKTISDFTADPDGDGLVNGLEYALGTSPIVSSLDLLPSLQINPFEDQAVSYRFVRDPSAQDAVLYPQISPDLSHWHNIAAVQIPGNPFEWLVTSSMTNQNRYFFRLSVGLSSP